jgi:uncharacterized protein YukE
MKTSQEIYMNFRATQEIVGELRRVAIEVRNVSERDVGDTLRMVRSAWQGENADAFMRKGDRLQRNIYETSQIIDELAKTLEQIANNTYKTEMEAIKIAQNK